MRVIPVALLLLSSAAACSRRATHPGGKAPTCEVQHEAEVGGHRSTQTYRFVVGHARAWLVEVETQLADMEATSQLRYDTRGRLIERTHRVHGDAGVSTTRYGYDALGRPNGCQTSEPASTTTTTLAYDDAGRLARVSSATVIHEATIWATDHDVTIWIRYGDDRRAPARPLGDHDRIYQVVLDATGRWHAFEDLGADGSNGAVELVYDPAGQMIGHRIAPRGWLRRDAAGRLDFRDAVSTRNHVYTYDALGRPETALLDTPKPAVPANPMYRSVPIGGSDPSRWYRHFSYRGCDAAPVADLTPWLLDRELGPPRSLACNPHIE